MKQWQVIRVVGDVAHVGNQTLDDVIVEHHIIGQRTARARLAAAAQSQEVFRRADDRFAQFVVVQPSHQVRRLVDRVGQLEVPGAVGKVLAAHRQHDEATGVRVEEVVDDRLDQRLRIAVVAVVRVEEFLELIDHEQEVRFVALRPDCGQLFRICLDEAREPCALTEHAGDVVTAQRGLGRFVNRLFARLDLAGCDPPCKDGLCGIEFLRKLPCEARDGCLRGDRRGDRRGARHHGNHGGLVRRDFGFRCAGCAHNRDPIVTGIRNAEATQLRHNASANQRRLAGARAADDGDEARLA